MSKLAPVFLLYVARSGSTFFSNQVSIRAPEIAVLPEFDLVALLTRQGEAKLAAMPPKAIGALLRTDPRWENLNWSSDELDAAIAAAGDKTIHGIISSIGAASAKRQGKIASRVMIKRGSNIRLFDRILENFPDARFIHIYRDPRGTAASQINQEMIYTKGQKLARGDIFHAARLWLRYMRMIEGVRARVGNRLYEVKYEHLVSDVEGTMTKLFSWLGTEHDTNLDAGKTMLPLSKSEEEQLHRLARKAPDAKRLTAWQTGLTAMQGGVIETTCGGQMRNRGYEPYFLTGAGVARRAAIRLYIKAYSPFQTASYVAGRVVAKARTDKEGVRGLPSEVRRKIRDFIQGARLKRVK